MSIYVADFKRAGGGWTVIHDDAPEGAHSGTIQPTDVDYLPAPGGGRYFGGMAITCPVCGASSFHPVGGGAQPRQVQEMFIRTLTRAGVACPCGALPAGRPALLVIAHLKTHADQMDGPGRWRIRSQDYTP